MLSLLILAQMAAPQPYGSRPIFTANDFPQSLANKGRPAGVLTRITVDSSGKTIRCEIEIPSIDRKANDLTCDIIMKRATFTPARLADGTASMSVLRLPVK